MLDPTQAYSGFAVDDLEQAKEFYGGTLGMDVADDGHGFLHLTIGAGKWVLIYQKEDHWPANFTILNFPVDDVEATVDDLAGKGVEFEHYDDPNFGTDEKGISRGFGAEIAWFRDPSGNILSVLSTSAGQER